MERSVFETINECAECLRMDLDSQEIADLALRYEMGDLELTAVAKVFEYLRDKKNETIVSTLLRLSRLPLKEAKTFEGFDFSQLHGRDAERLQDLPSLSALYARRNLSFIGPQGVGKTHLAMAYGRECCLRASCIL